jgi:hypothetical protein
MSTDPLKQGPHAEQELFKRFSEIAAGFPRDAVAGAAANLLINCIRQNSATRAQAEVAFDELFGKLKAITLAHYDGAGNRRSVFPFNQAVVVPFIDLRRKN